MGQKINADVNRALADPEVQQQLAAFGFDAAPGTPEQLGAFIASESKRFADLVKRTGATAK